MIEQALNKIREQNAKIAELKKEMAETAKNTIGDIIKDVFETHGSWLKSFSWTQYTPYFNDGDTCYFGVNLDEYSIEINGENLDDEINWFHEYNDWEKTEPNPDFDQNKANVINQLIILFQSIDEDTLKSIFGDHVKVTATKDGFEIEDCVHE